MPQPVTVPADSTLRFHKTKEAAAIIGTSVDRVIDLIRAGELRASNISRSVDAKRPTWRISDADLRAFMDSRSSAPAPTLAPPKPSRKKRAKYVPKVYVDLKT